MESMFKPGLLAGKRILVTGGGTGLGAAIAGAAATLGARVYICGRRPEVLTETAARLSEETCNPVRAIACDIRAADEVDSMVAQIWADGGALSGLINNAPCRKRMEEAFRCGFAAIADTVFRGSFYVTLACGKRWIEGGARASVVSILADGASAPGAAPSALPKAGANIMTATLAREWAAHGIRLNAVAPGGPDRTEDAARQAECVNLALFLVSDGASSMTGQSIALDSEHGSSQPANVALCHAEWARIRAEIRSANATDKARRAV